MWRIGNVDIWGVGAFSNEEFHDFCITDTQERQLTFEEFKQIYKTAIFEFRRRDYN